MKDIHIGNLIGFIFVVIVPLAMFSHKALAPLFVITILIGLAVSLRNGGLNWQLGKAELIFGVTVILSLLSIIWSVTPDESLKTGISFTATVVGGTYLLNRAQSATVDRESAVMKLVIYGGGLGFVLLGWELITGAHLTRILLTTFSDFRVGSDDTRLTLNVGASLSAIVIWPWLLVLYKLAGWRVLIVLAALYLSLIVFSEAAAPKLAFGVGLVLFAATSISRRVAPVLFSLMILLATLLSPMIAANLPNPAAPDNGVEHLSNSAAHRLLIWRNTVPHIKDNPVLGLGFDTTRSLYSKEDRRIVEINPGSLTNNWRGLFEPIPLHPHNGVLQIWMEFGILGAITFMALAMMIIRWILKLNTGRVEKALCFAAYASGLTIYALSFGAWQSWWLASLFLITASTISFARIGGQRMIGPDGGGEPVEAN